MSDRLTAPARSPLRRTVGKDSPTRPKKSPVRAAKQDPKKVLEVDVGKSIDPEADALRAQAQEIEHDINHLSPALQRFWQVGCVLTVVVHNF